MFFSLSATTFTWFLKRFVKVLWLLRALTSSTTLWVFHQIRFNSWHSGSVTSMYVHLIIRSFHYLWNCFEMFLCFFFHSSTIGAELFVSQHYVNTLINWHSLQVNRCKQLHWAMLQKSLNVRSTFCKLKQNRSNFFTFFFWTFFSSWNWI